MRWVFLLLFVFTSSLAKEEETNEVNPPPKIPVNLDANLRRALLKALTELENEDNEKKQQHETSERIVEKASASALSFFASTESPTTKETSTTTEYFTHKPIVVIQRSNGLQQKPITSLEKYSDSNENEQIITSASSSFTSSSNKFSLGKSDNSLDLVTKELKATTKLTKPKTETTTVTTTTSTEESEAKVEDVQFFSAPLVAAFTVHQDERGLPKSVEPIYRTTQRAEEKVKAPLTTQQPLPQEQIRTQFALQEKQRALEAEILRLKQQQQQQNYLIRQQQILHQQQLQLQKQKIIDEQSRFLQNQHFLPTAIPSFPTTTQRTDFTRDSLVSFQPSLSFTSHQNSRGVLPFNAQQLPVKNPIDFRSPFQQSNSIQQFNYLRNQQPPLENSASNFHLAPSIEPPLTLTAPRPQSHRVFRQEANTGNFLNGGFGSFNSFNSFQQPNNRFFRSNVETFRSQPLTFNQAQPPVVNQQLNHLLYNSGLIRGKQHEDLNIVSKVLSLNHFGGDYRFDASNVREHRVPPPVIKKV